MAWKMIAYPATQCLAEEYGKKLGITEVTEVLVLDDEKHTYCCSMSPDYEAWPVAVCFTLTRPFDELSYEEVEELDNFGWEWVNDQEHNPYIPATQGYTSCPVEKDAALSLRMADDAGEDVNIRDVINTVFEGRCLTTAEYEALGISGPNYYVVCR